MSRMSTSAKVFARIGVGWAGSYVMTRAFAREIPGEPAIAVIADMLNRLDLLSAGELPHLSLSVRNLVDLPLHPPWPHLEAALRFALLDGTTFFRGASFPAAQP